MPQPGGQLVQAPETCGLVFQPQSNYANIENAFESWAIPPQPQKRPDDSSHHQFKPHQQFLASVEADAQVVCKSDPDQTRVTLLSGFNNVAELHNYDCRTRKISSKHFDKCNFESLDPLACGFQWYDLRRTLNSNGTYNATDVTEYTTPDGHWNGQAWCQAQIKAEQALGEYASDEKIQIMQQGLRSLGACEVGQHHPE